MSPEAYRKPPELAWVMGGDPTWWIDNDPLTEPAAVAGELDDVCRTLSIRVQEEGRTPQFQTGYQKALNDVLREAKVPCLLVEVRANGGDE